MAALCIAASVAWSAFAFGGVYPWAAPPLLFLAAAAAWFAGARPVLTDTLDATALAAVAVIALQLLPLPPAALTLLSPSSRTFRADMMLGYDAGAWLPLSLDPASTRLALVLAAAAYWLFAAARAIDGVEGGRVARWVAWTALALSVIGIGGRTLFSDGRIYWFWSPLEPGAAPFGAIINRNHFAVWAALAAALTAGSFASQASRRRQDAPAKARLIAAMTDARAPWLLFSMLITIAALITTGSRSGFAAIVAAAAAAMLMVRLRAGRRVAAGFAVAAVMLGVAVIGWAQSDRLLTRLSTTGGQADSRQTIWHQSAAMARRYPLTGVGLGAFPAGMAYYQAGSRDVFFNHAHNQYLELGAEGGLMLAIPLVLFLTAAVVRIRRELRADGGSYFWMRAGAAAGLAGLLIAAIWESPFRTPATLMLAAAAVGLATANRRG